MLTGPDVTEFEFTDTKTSNGGAVTNIYTYVLENGRPGQCLSTEFVDAVTIEVVVTSGGPFTFQLVRVTLGPDGFSVEVAEVIESTELSPGESATLSADL